MIFVDGLPFTNPASDGNKNLVALLEHPSLVAAVELFKAIPEEKYSGREQSNLENSLVAKHVYLFQREYATVNPALVELVGTDEATTCVGLVIRNQNNGMTSVAHLDSPGVVDLGLTQMLSLIFDNDEEAKLDVHLVGGFEDASYEHSNATAELDNHERSGGYSLRLCSKIVEALQSRQENFHIQTLCVLRHNTVRASGGDAHPILETSTGSIRPAGFDRSSRCPDEIVRRIRVTVSSTDHRWDGKLLETYDTYHDRFHIAPCSWALYWRHYASSLQQYSDSEILLKCSTSPSAEGPDFVDNERRVFDYLIKYPDWRQTFPKGKPRVFERAPNGGWTRCK
ncbi:protein N-terminal asparagine amidohydrolase isoform X4 [Cinnamomum micranthum f. kanehirae]|uniref:Protein N-terminal asparagine amidohydrolase isoform X4 n=1 Tax=Cinnamomum micranthum f. kanehirae TaxID=337451 RepID=A0A443N5M3_9MAGN|nr:protein N-terminal asparagine amidohydrolase isoform X4 [Cinnamomum micranthum f. kanehirae]